MLAELARRGRAFLHGRKGSYYRAFNPESPDGQAVLRDLARFCRAHESTAHPDPYMRGQLDGRREVWLRIQHHLRLTDEDIWRLYEPRLSKMEDM